MTGCLKKLFFMFLAVGGVCVADSLELPPVFLDRMVLQRGKPVPVWGTAPPGSEVSVKFSGQTKTTAVTVGGKWEIKLDPLVANKRPQNLVVCCGDETVALSDVLVGEVWLCSGQSNMAMPLQEGSVLETVVGAVAEFLLPENKLLRLYSDDGNKFWGAQKWQTARPETVKVFSATAYFFGKKLQAELDVPIGLVNISRGGTTIQAWTPKEYALRAPVTARYTELYRQYQPKIQEYNRAFKSYREARAKWNANRQGDRPQPPASLPGEVDVTRTFSSSSGLYERYIAPQVPFAMRGVIWYQGESNAKWNQVARHYDDMLRELINGWRASWNQPEMPFYFVQLPIWGKASENWPWVRQGMLNVCQSMPDTGMAVTVDVGEPDNLHPPRKQPVGERLALWALAKTYGKTGVYSGPLPAEVCSKGKGLRIRFSTFGSALDVHGGEWKDIEVAGEDGVYHPASAAVGASDALVACPQVKTPVRFRYGWKGSFEPTLFNAEGLPASPFCFVRAADGAWRLGVGSDFNGGTK